MDMAIQLLRKRRSFPFNLTLVHRFSSDSGDRSDRRRSAFNFFLRDVKSSLKSPPQPSPTPTPRLLRRSPTSESPPPPPDPPNSRALEDVRKVLSSFKSSPTFSPAGAPALSLRESITRPSPGGVRPKSFADIGRSQASAKAEESVKRRPVHLYSKEELGERLRALRPGAGEGGDWFSWEELNLRLTKIVEADDAKLKEANSIPGWHMFFAESTETNNKPNPLDIIQNAVAPPSDYMNLPPKDHLLETYYHPDNMSAAEKMKLELAKVRDEFKISESDCGSTRVQVALLTTKIKYLTSVLHKKDKHSRKGLVEMTHKRKRLLKYLRRTDWESYCYVLDKLGLRDVRNYNR